MTQKLFDVHAHVQFATFEKDADLVIQRALDKGVWLINVGTQKDTSAKAVELANKYKEGVYASVGLHPIHTEKSYHDPHELGGETGFASRGEEFDYNYYKKLAQDPKVVAIGECGLDYYRLTQESGAKQFKAFEAQIELAVEIQKPLMIHCRQAFLDLIDILNTKYRIFNIRSGVIHFFSGSKEDARNLLNMGFSFSFGGVITFARDYDEAIKYIPLERILLETDAPYVAPTPYRGKRNEPAYIDETAARLAEIKGLSKDRVSEQTTHNAIQTFGIK